MCTNGVSRVGFCDLNRRMLPGIGNVNKEKTSIFGDGNKVNSPTVIVNNGVINNGPGAGSVNSDGNTCQGNQQGMVMRFMARIMEMLASLMEGQNGQQLAYQGAGGLDMFI